MIPPSRPYRVLVVDDDAPLREAVRHRLRRLGHYVVTAASAEAVLADVETGQPPYDVVITDVHLPEMNGVQLASILLDRARAARAVIVTGDHDEALARDALSHSGVSYLLKPFEMSELEALVEERKMQ